MYRADEDIERDNHPIGRFPTTPWDWVSASADPTDEGKAREALEALLRLYWTPLYRFACQAGNSHHVAEDVTQSFIARMLSRNSLASVRREKGRFRTFLLSALTHYLVDLKRSAHSMKRGGSQTSMALDPPKGEDETNIEAVSPDDPRAQFMRDWAWAVVRCALDRLRMAYDRAGKSEVFERVRARLDSSEVPTRYADLERQLDLDESALKVEVHRARKRLRSLILEELGRGVGNAAELAEEVEFWKRALRGD